MPKCRRVCGWVGKRERVWCFGTFEMMTKPPLVTTPTGGGGEGWDHVNACAAHFEK